MNEQSKRRGTMVSWKTVLEKTPQVGDKISLPTFHGIREFVVSNIDENSGTTEYANWMVRIKKDMTTEEWIVNHCLIDKSVTVTAVIADVVYSPPPQYKLFRFGHSYMNKSGTFVITLLRGSRHEGYQFAASHSNFFLGKIQLLSRIVPNDGNWTQIPTVMFNTASRIHSRGWAIA
jgi:hypothetical protein